MPTFTIRLPEKDHEALSAMALLTGQTMAELVREAIVEKVTRYADDAEVERRIEEDAERRRAAFKALRDASAS